MVIFYSMLVLPLHLYPKMRKKNIQQWKFSKLQEIIFYFTGNIFFIPDKKYFLSGFWNWKKIYLLEKKNFLPDV